MSSVGFFLSVLVLLASSGCAMIQKSDAMDTERTLAAAGFQMKFASTPEQTAKTAALPQRTFSRSAGPDGYARFVWADATYCKCIYVGSEAAYDRYQRLVITEDVADENLNASMNWDAWGGWGPWY